MARAVKVEEASTRPVLGMGLKTCAIFLFTAMAAIIKATADDVPAGEAVFFRSFFAIPVILIWLAQRGELRTGLRVKNPFSHVKRGLIGTMAMGLTFTGLGMLPLPEVTAIGFATPIFTVVLAAILLGERIRMFRLSAVAVGLVGVLVILSPNLGSDRSLGDSATMGAITILVATLLRSLVQIQIRQMVQSEQTSAIVFYFSVTASVAALLTMPFGWVVPRADTLALLVSAGLVGGVAQILVTASYRFGSAAALAPLDYTSMLFAIVIGYVVFSELPTVIMLVGASLVILAGGLVIWRERQLGLSRQKARQAAAPKA